MHDDLERLEMDPHRMSRICEAAMQQCVCKEEVTEFIGHVWLGNWQDRQNDRARRESGNSHYQCREPFPARELIKTPFGVVKPSGAESRYAKGKDKRNKYQAEFNPAHQLAAYSTPDPECGGYDESFGGSPMSSPGSTSHARRPLK